jgi:hypothetical protein
MGQIAEPSDDDFMHVWLPFDDTPGGAVCLTADLREWNRAMDKVRDNMGETWDR